MILAAVFGVFSVIAIIRLGVFALFTSRSGNIAGAAALWVFAVIILSCFVLAVIQL